MTSPAIAPRQLDSRERLQLAWALVWPPLVVDLLMWLVCVYYLRLSKSQLSDVTLVSSLVNLFVILPWVVRRAVRLNFPQFHLLVHRPLRGEQTRAMDYRESLSVTWLIAWRVGIVVAALVAVAGIVIGILRGVPLPMDQDSLAQSFIGAALSVAILVLWVAHKAITKNYARFSLRISRPEEAVSG